MSLHYLVVYFFTITDYYYMIMISLSSLNRQSYSFFMRKQNILQKFTKEWLDIFQNQYFIVYLQQLSTN